MATERDTPDGTPLDPVLAEAIRGLRDRGPKHDLWSGIAPRLTPRRPAGMLQMRWPTALAAGLALVAGSVAVTQWLGREPIGEPIAVQATGGNELPVVAVMMDEAGVALETAIRDLTATIEAALPQLDAATRDELTQAMQALDRAVADATDRVSAAPDDVRAAQYLTTTLRRQQAVLRTIAVAASRS